MNIICGIDPGQSGALAFFWPASPHMISAVDMPVADGQVDGASLADSIRMMTPDVVVVETAHSMPGQGVSSTFKFGRSFGIAIGVVQGLQIPLHFVGAGRWKKHFHLSSDKEASRALALRLWPHDAHQFRRKKDEARAEAALIAKYFAETQGVKVAA